MEAITIHGGIRLQGNVKIQGSKNAVLPILAATILTKGQNVIQNCPKLKDVFCMTSLLKEIGCEIHFIGSNLYVDATEANFSLEKDGLCGEAVCAMRSSITLLGALLGRFGEACLSYPGGCIIGARPIDLHLVALRKLGACFEETDEKIFAKANFLKGAKIHLSFPSVGATENSILAAVCAEGITEIIGAAKEPEILSLCAYLKKCGAKIKGEESGHLFIEGTKKLSGTVFTIPGDRIVAGTYLCATMAAMGEVYLENAPVEDMGETIKTATLMGAICQADAKGLYVMMKERPLAVNTIITGPYPDFPTDMQSLFLAVLLKAKGECVVEERIFENRFLVASEFQKFGADITMLDENRVLVKGVESLRGAKVEAKELRGGAALVVAALSAEDITVVRGCRYIERGYENICRDLRELGVRIYGV